MRIERLTVAPLGVNCYILIDDSPASEYPSAVIDPGSEPQKIIEFIKKLGVKPVLILNTHGHLDHTGGVKALKKAFNASYLIHEADAGSEESIGELLVMMRIYGAELPPEPDGFLTDNQILGVGGLAIEVMHTPGHTPGGVCFKVDDVVFSGDTLFAGGIGRTDFEGGSMEDIMASINKRLLVLDNDTRVLPGHGPETTIGREKAANPWLAGNGGKRKS